MMVVFKCIVLVIGVGFGIGWQIMFVLLCEGYGVVLVGCCQDVLEEIVKLVGEYGVNVLVVVVDVIDLVLVKQFFVRICECFGCLDMFFNNVGIFVLLVLLEELSVEQWKVVVDINLIGVFFCM